MELKLKLAAAAVLIAASAGTASAECMRVSGLGTGVTPDIAQFMANKALKDSIANRGLKSAGKSSMMCDSSMVVVSNCTAVQRACK